MRFASLERTVLAQPEVSLGTIPRGGGTQRLPPLIGRGRAVEVVLGYGDLDGATAERWGYVNRALPDAELRPFVDALATRIASFPPEAVARAKTTVDAALPDPVGGPLVEDREFRASPSDPETADRMAGALALGIHTREVERGALAL
jgi:enoyl-CoA hydratase/carnithine racemase